MGVGPPPFEGPVTVIAWCLAFVLCIGVMTAPLWHWRDRARRAVGIDTTV